MAELGRVAHAALRASPLLRVTTLRAPCLATTRRRYLSTSTSLCSSKIPSQQKPYTTFGRWTDPTRMSRDMPEDIDIKKPNSKSYDFASQSLDDDSDFSASDITLEMFNNRKKVESLPPAKPREHNMHLVPRLGRTVHVRKNVDVARSFKLLAVQVASNKVRSQWQQQRFHERPGLKRKRLASQRWQARFKKGFKAAVVRVQELTRQGW
ncbi:hypothetical protein F5Y16DRAFT_361562 [Xylariaceae sp. FL0255]|nr:hypothetical protein F5Y16DRAFT_361562 [Xylariaceae sp. FL0255]